MCGVTTVAMEATGLQLGLRDAQLSDCDGGALDRWFPAAAPRSTCQFPNADLEALQYADPWCSEWRQLV
jgi:hypothetical protein